MRKRITNIAVLIVVADIHVGGGGGGAETTKWIVWQQIFI